MAIKKDVKKTSEFKKFLELNSLLKIVSILFILSITVLTIVNIFGGKEHGINGQQDIITVSGHSEINVKPDTTSFVISVTETGKDLKSSQTAATNKINSAIIVLKQNGVLDKNIKTLSFNTYPKYSTRTASCATSSPAVKSKINSTAPASPKAVSVKAPSAPTTNSKVVAVVGAISAGSAGGSNASAGIAALNCIDRTSEVIGYETSQSIEVKITDIDRNPDLAGILVSAVAKLGVQTSALNSYVDNLDTTKQKVRDQAIQKAKVQAQSIALSLGIKLGKITSFSENTNGGYPYPMMMSAKMVETADSAVPNLPVGEDKVTSDVSITYRIR